MKRLKASNDMRNSVTSKMIVRRLENVAVRAAAIKNTGDKRVRRITSELMPLLDSVAPDYELQNMKGGSMGYGGTEKTFGYSKESEYLRRQGGAEVIGDKAQKALSVLTEVEKEIFNNSRGFAQSIRSKEIRKKASKWTRLVSAAKYVAAGVATVGAGVAAYFGIKNGVQVDTESYRLAMYAAMGGLAASAVLSKGQKSVKLPKLEAANELSGVSRILNNLKLNLSELARYKPATQNK
jgi:hypothetical protein